MLRLVSVCLLFSLCHAAAYMYDRWSDDNSVFDRPRAAPSVPRATSSNLGCFLCTQLLSVTKHRVGLSQNQLRNVLYEKCRVLPSVLREQCFTFVDTSLPEIYFSLNYDFSSKDVCVTLNLCEENNPFAVATPPPTQAPPTLVPVTAAPATMATLTLPPHPSVTESPEESSNTDDVLVVEETEKEVEEERVPATTRATAKPSPSIPPMRTQTVPTRRLLKDRNLMEKPTTTDRIGHKNEDREKEDKRMTCKFCERMLENAKMYAVTAKSDITSFANNACSKLPKGRFADQCYELADKKIEELAKFVDHQVIEALWCAELNQC